MKRKFFLMVIVILLLSGCSASYDLIINEDNTVQDKVIISEEKVNLDEKFGVYDESYAKEYTNNYINELVNNWKNKLGLNDEDFYRSDSDSEYRYYKNDSYFNIFDIKNSKVLKNIFNNIDIKNNGTIYSISLEDFNKEVLSNISTYNFNFTLPYLIVESNGVVENNVCKWSFTNKSSPSLYISYDISKKYDEIREDEEQEQGKVDYKKVLIISGLVLVVLLFFYFIFKVKFNKNNSI